MFKLAFWSLSNHLLTKVLPSIKNNKKFKFQSILTKKKKKVNFGEIKWFDNKKRFISNNNFDYVYISSINSKHFENTKIALENKKMSFVKNQFV